MNPKTLKRLDPLARRLGFYTAYTLSEAEFIGNVETGDTDELVTRLRHIGYEESPTFMGVTLEAAKLSPTEAEPHDYAFRKVAPSNRRKQYHIHIWYGGEQSAVFSHREYRPDVRPVGGESLREMYDRLQTHYRPEYGEDYEQGKACDELRELVDGHE